MAMSESKPQYRWFQPTPIWLIYGSLLVTTLLFLSDIFVWPAWKKGFAVLVAVTGAGSIVLLMVLWCLAAMAFRWRLQFTVRTLLLLVVAVAAPFSWFAKVAKSARRQEAAVQCIKNFGGTVWYDWEYDQNDHYSPALRPPGPTWLRAVVGKEFLADVVDVTVGESGSRRFTDAGLEHVAALSRLRGLDLCYTHVTDAGLAHIAGLARLRRLDLSFTQVTDAGVAHLAALTELESLGLNNTERHGYRTGTPRWDNSCSRTWSSTHQRRGRRTHNSRPIAAARRPMDRLDQGH